MSKSVNKLLSSFFFIVLVLTGFESSALAAAFAPAVSLPAGSGPSAMVSGFFDGLCSPSQSGQVALWSGENNAEDSIGTQDGSLVNGTAFVAGRIGQAFSLDGADDYVEVPDSTVLDIAAQITLSAWINPTALGGRIIDKLTAGVSNGYLLDTFGGKVRLIATSTGSADGSTSLPLNAWTHVAGVFDGTQLRVYVNGQLDGTTDVTDTTPTNNLPLRIGADSNGDNRFSGLIDEASVYNRALSATEVLNLYNYACATPTPDVAVANFLDDTVSVMLGNGDGTFTTTNFDVGTAPYAVISGDFNSDGNADLAVANSGSNNITILFGNGTGDFPTVATYPVGTTPYSLTSGDLDGDGNIDLAVANLKSGNISILIGNGAGSFSATDPAVFPVGGSPVAIVAADFNTDEVDIKDELAVADSNGHSVSILSLKKELDETYTMTVDPKHKYTVGSTPLALVTGDFNGDGMPDLAVANGNSKNISVLLGMGTNLMAAPVHYTVDEFPASLTTGDLNGDGKIDLAATHISGNTLSVLYGNGNGKFQAPLSFPVGKYPLAVAAGDFDADGLIDLLTANYDTDTLSLLINAQSTGINVTSPAGGEQIQTGASLLITWNAFPGAVTYTIFYSSDNGIKFKKLAKVGNVTSYDWTVPLPKLPNSNDNLIKIVGYDANKKVVAEGRSKSSFAIEAVSIVSPNGGEIVSSEGSMSIVWSTYITKKTPTSVKLYYSKYDAAGVLSWTLIDTITGNPGSYLWTLPLVDATRHNYLVKVELRAGSTVLATDISDRFFTIELP